MYSNLLPYSLLVTLITGCAFWQHFRRSNLSLTALAILSTPFLVFHAIVLHCDAAPAAEPIEFLRWVPLLYTGLAVLLCFSPSNEKESTWQKLLWSIDLVGLFMLILLLSIIYPYQDDKDRHHPAQAHTSDRPQPDTARQQDRAGAQLAPVHAPTPGTVPGDHEDNQ